MTKKRLRDSVALVMAVFALVIAFGSASRFLFRSDAAYQAVKDFSPLIIALGAAYLAYCFQQRQAFLASLRDLWKELVGAKGELIEYTHCPNPDRAGFVKAQRALSRAIDFVRGVYRNVGETETDIGLFPFEPLHDMRKAFDELGYSDVTPEQRAAAHARLIRSWNALRWAFLKEFATPPPSHPITTIGAADPRRTGADREDPDGSIAPAGP